MTLDERIDWPCRLRSQVRSSGMRRNPLYEDRLHKYDMALSEVIDDLMKMQLQGDGEEWLAKYTGQKNNYWCKFRNKTNCDFCSFHSECDISYKGD